MASILTKESTILREVLKILRKDVMGPSAIAERGLNRGVFRIPKYRTRGYVTQRIQTVLYNQLLYASRPAVKRLRPGAYKAK